MAEARLVIPFFKKWEGGYVNDPDDAGGCTCSGITIGTYRKYYGNNTCYDLRHITEEEWLHIFKIGYWDKMKADYIDNQSIAQLCVDMCWGSGPVTAIKRIQRCLGVEADGIVGKVTLAALNAPDRKATFDKLWNMRYNWFISIANLRNNKKYLKGWHNRLKDIKFYE